MLHNVGIEAVVSIRELVTSLLKFSRLCCTVTQFLYQNRRLIFYSCIKKYINE